MVRDIEARKHRAKLAEGETEFSLHASVEEARAAFDQVCKGAGVPNAWVRVERDARRSTLVEVQNALRKAGIQSKGIQDLQSHNMNRFSRAEAASARANLLMLEPCVAPSDHAG